MTTVTVKQSDIQALLDYAKIGNNSYVTSGSDYKLFQFLKKYANNFTYVSTRMGIQGRYELNDFCAPYSNQICEYTRYQQDLQDTQNRVANSNGSSNVTVLNEVSYIYEDSYNPFLIQFHEGEVKNTEEYAQVEEPDLANLLKVVESARLKKYDKYGNLSIWFEFLVTYCPEATVGYQHEIGLSEEQTTQQMEETLYLTNLAKFRKLYDDKTYDCKCDCDCPKCDGFQVGYSFSDLYISRDKTFAEFTVSTPEGQIYYAFCKYTK